MTALELFLHIGSLAILVLVVWLALLNIRGRVAREAAVTRRAITAELSSTVLGMLRKDLVAAVASRDPGTIYTHDIEFADSDVAMRAPMILDASLEVCHNIRMILTYQGTDRSVLTLRTTGPAFLPRHRHHDAAEEIEVKVGTVTQLLNGHEVVYGPGERWLIPADEWHAAAFSENCLALVTCYPALPSSLTHPVRLAGMDAAFTPKPA